MAEPAAHSPGGRASGSRRPRPDSAPAGPVPEVDSTDPGPGAGPGAGLGAGSGPVLDVYARLSKAHNGETVQVEDQVELCVEKIAARGARVGEVFKDNSLSAWNPKVVRPSWNALMARLESGASDGVMVYDLFRFSRKVIEGERLVELAAGGARVWALSGEYDLTTADGRRHFRESMVAAAGESDKISERVKRGKVRRARKGRHHGGGRAYAMPGWAPAPPGWEPGDVREQAADERVAAEQQVVRECYERLFAGDSVSALVRDLNARGAGGERAALPVSGLVWRRGVFVRSMTRASLAGLLEHQGAVVGALAGVEPVISREEWERMRALFAARKTGRPPSPRHLLSGLFVCAACGASMLGFPRSALPPYPDGEGKREYRCRPRGDRAIGGCGRNYIDGRVADEAVATAVVARLGDPRRADRIAHHLAGVREERSRVEAEIARWEATADDLVTKTATWGVARVDAAMAPILARIAALQGELAALQEPDSNQAAVADAVAAWEQARADGDIAAQRALVRRAFPNLAIAMPTRWSDHNPARFHWDDTTT